MAYFSIDAFPDLNEFTVGFGASGYDMLSVSQRLNNFVGLWDRFSFGEYRNQTFFRYQIFTDIGKGIIRVDYPVASGPSVNYTTPWFRVGNPTYITIIASPSAGFTFNGWYEYPFGPLVGTTNPWNIPWNQTTSNTLYARFI